MHTNKCDITVVLDRSGSMQSIAKDMVGGFNDFINTQKQNPGEAVVTLVQFDDRYEFVHRAKDIKDFPEISMTPRGSTALLDAVGRAITETGERLRDMPEAERPGKVVFLIITDGEENASKEFKKAQVLEKIKHQQDVYKWEFVFLGANQDAFAEARDIGINLSNVGSYVSSKKGVNALWSSTMANLTSYRSGVTASMAYTDKQKEDMAAS